MLSKGGKGRGMSEEEERGRELLDVCTLLLGCGYSCRSFCLGREKHQINHPNQSNPKTNTGSRKHLCALFMLACNLSPFRHHLLVVLATPDHLSIKMVSHSTEVPEREYNG